MALNDEIRIDASTSKRSQITGHLLIVMPKLNVKNAISIVHLDDKCSKSKVKSSSQLNGHVNIRNIIIDEAEIPPLV
jgi:hypothetical protein